MESGFLSEHHDHKHGDGGFRNDTAHTCSTQPSALIVELREHVPFSVSAVAIGLIAAGTICILGATLGEGLGAQAAHAGHDPGAHEHASGFAGLFFHLFHPAHMLFSGAATAAMFVRYERKFLKAILVGLVGAVGICGISDIVLPHLSLMMLDTKAPWHICVIERPGMVLPFAGIGVLIGISTAGGTGRSTVVSHSLHVLASTMASIFYMVGPLGVVAWIDRIGAILLFTILAVVVPCCASDIVFPMLMSRAGRQKYELEPHVH